MHCQQGNFKIKGELDLPLFVSTMGTLVSLQIIGSGEALGAIFIIAGEFLLLNQVSDYVLKSNSLLIITHVASTIGRHL